MKARESITAVGYTLDADGRPIRQTVDTSTPGDYGADPVGDGTFRMVPSGDVVSYEEMLRRRAAMDRR